MWDYDKYTAHDLIGEFTFTVDELLNGKKDFPIINPKKLKKKKYENSGIFHFDKACISNREVIKPNPQYKELEDKIQKEKSRYKNEYRVIRNPHTFVQYLAGGLELSLIVAIDFTGRFALAN